MESIIEANDWKQFKFRMVCPEDYPRVLEHLHANFFLSTPLKQKLEFSKDYFDEFDKIYLKVLPQGLSFYVMDKETNEIAGVRITFVQTRELESEFESLNFQTKQMKILNLIMGTVNKNSKIYEKFGIDHFINFYSACVDSKYRGNGLASEIYNRALVYLRAHPKWSKSIVKSNITSPYTLKICQNYGFIELARVYYNDFKDENGNPLCVGWRDDEFVAFMCLQL